MLLTGRRLSAQEAFDRGLVNRIVPRDKLTETAEGLALKIASLDPAVVRNARQAVIQGLDMTLDQGLELEGRLSIQTRQQKKLSEI
jgi:enoyl-CoA hydratase/carnithine racemase